MSINFDVCYSNASLQSGTREVVDSSKTASIALRILGGACVIGGVISGALACSGVLPVGAGIAGITLVFLGSVVLVVESYTKRYDDPEALKSYRREALFRNFTEVLYEHGWENMARYGIPFSETKHLHRMSQLKERLTIAERTERHASHNAEREFEQEVKGRRLILNVALQAAETLYSSHPAHAKLRRHHLSFEQRTEYQRDLTWARNLRNQARDAANFAFDRATETERKAFDKKIDKAGESSAAEIDAINQDYRAMCRQIS